MMVGGLGSPGRWPKERRRLPSWPGRDLLVNLKDKLSAYWEQVTGGKGKLLDFVLHLAAGRCKENPFDQDFTGECLEL